MDHATRWTELITGPAPLVHLDEAALLIAAHARPDLDTAAELGRLDRLAEQVEGGGADAVGDLLFRRLGIRGDTATYDDPANSLLDRVLDRSLGIPISLSVLMIEVGRRRDVPLEGVGMPGHFLVRDRRRPESLIDPFGGGRRLDDDACLALLRRVAGPDAHLHPALLATTPTLGIVMRMLANLDRAYRRRRDANGLAWVTRLRVTVPDQPTAVLVEAADTLGELGRYDEAASVLDEVVGRPDVPGSTATSLQAQAASWRARLN